MTCQQAQAKCSPHNISFIAMEGKKKVMQYLFLHVSYEPVCVSYPNWHQDSMMICSKFRYAEMQNTGWFCLQAYQIRKNWGNEPKRLRSSLEEWRYKNMKTFGFFNWGGLEKWSKLTWGEVCYYFISQLSSLLRWHIYLHVSLSPAIYWIALSCLVDHFVCAHTSTFCWLSIMTVGEESNRTLVLTCQVWFAKQIGLQHTFLTTISEAMYNIYLASYAID